MPAVTTLLTAAERAAPVQRHCGMLGAQGVPRRMQSVAAVAVAGG